MLSPALRICSDGCAAFGIELVLPVCGASRTSEVSGNMTTFTPIRCARHFISRMSGGSTQPGRMLICFLSFASSLRQNIVTSDFAIFAKPVTCEPT